MRETRYTIPQGLSLRSDVHYEFYPVFGKAFSELIQSVEENAPFDKSRNRRSPSRLEWSAGWTYDFTFTEEVRDEDMTVHITLIIDSVNVMHDITVTLPALFDDSSLNQVEKELWIAYVNKLIEHEHEKVRIITDAASKNEAISRIKAFDYLAFDYSRDADIEKTIEIFLREQTAEIGREYVKGISARLSKLK